MLSNDTSSIINNKITAITVSNMLSILLSNNQMLYIAKNIKKYGKKLSSIITFYFLKFNTLSVITNILLSNSFYYTQYVLVTKSQGD